MPAALHARYAGRALLPCAAIALSLSADLSGAHAQSCESPAWWDANNGLLPRFGTIVPLDFVEYDPDGPGPQARELVVCGFFDFQGQAGNSAAIARWDGVRWQGIDTGLGQSGLDYAWDMTIVDYDGPGPSTPRLVVCGAFYSAGGQPLNSIAEWNGTAWNPIPWNGGLVWSVEAFDPDGSGPLYERIAINGGRSWDGVASYAMPAPASLQGTFASMKAFDPDGPGPAVAELFGVKSNDTSQSSMGTIARWSNGQWVSTGGSAQTNVTYKNFGEFDPDGVGPLPSELLVCGDRVQKWNGISWMPLGGAIAGQAVGSIDPDGDGPLTPIIVTGRSNTASVAGTLLFWNGAAWAELSPLASIPLERPFLGGTAYAIGAFDPDGPGPQGTSCFLGGEFGAVGSMPALGLARFGCAIDFGRCAADCSFNGVVDFHDITTILANWGSTDPYADGNRDGVVGFTDITLALASWGEYCPENLGSAPVASRAAPPPRPEGISPQYAALLDARDAGDFRRMTEILVSWDARQPSAAVAGD